MNGQMYQIACIVAAAKYALKNNTDIFYTSAEYEKNIEFRFLPRFKILHARGVHTVRSVPA